MPILNDSARLTQVNLMIIISQRMLVQRGHELMEDKLFYLYPYLIALTSLWFTLIVH